MEIYGSIRKLINYGLDTGLITKADERYTINQILCVLKLAEYEEPDVPMGNVNLEEILQEFLSYGLEQGLILEDRIVYKDLFDTKLMNCLMPRPSQVIHTFWDLYHNQSKEEATSYYYKLSQDSDYIRRYRVCKDQKWVVDTEYGTLDITVNLSKPEKDPRDIAAEKSLKQSGYPKCLLCMENEGYAGRINHPARNNHRIIPIEINQSEWGFQYSPYVYYPEHCIVFYGKHVPMKIERETFVKLLDFVELFPHYFLGSNADLPIVGGSILSHDHFQGGNYTFAMANAPIEASFRMEEFANVEVGIVKWPMSVIRLRSKEPSSLVDAASKILDGWRAYSDEEACVFAMTEGQLHNTITPIARNVNGVFEFDLVLRNNLTTKEHPFGLYHPHSHLHHIKKENIGLIEVMGLAVLPSRLKEELALLAQFIVEKQSTRGHEQLDKHTDWVEGFLPKYTEITTETVEAVLQEEVGLVFKEVLEDAGVYKCDEEGRRGFVRFLNEIGIKSV